MQNKCEKMVRLTTKSVRSKRLQTLNDLLVNIMQVSVQQHLPRNEYSETS